MVMGWIWVIIATSSLLGAVLTGHGSQLASAIPQGAHAGITLAISLAGSICLWSGVGNLMDKIGLTAKISWLLSPILHIIFPSTKNDQILASQLSANICANILGLGNAATPMGIQAAKRLSQNCNGIASNQLCRLIVLNTASIQLIPANVAALRSGLGATNPFDILPAVWITSLCSASAGLLAAGIMGKIYKK